MQTDILTFSDKRCLIGNTPESLRKYKTWFVYFGGVELSFDIMK